MLRIGEGYDVHAFANDRDLILGGVKIPYELGLIGHSDADVLIHSIMDSLLGAFALYDIGKYFSDKDLNYKNINSMQLLRYVDAICKKYIYDFKNTINTTCDDINIPNYVMDKNGYDLLLNDENIKNISYIVNIDTIVVCQNPKLSKYIDDIRKNIASVLNISIFQISVKATTEEKLGFTGNMKGIKCKSVCLLNI